MIKHDFSFRAVQFDLARQPETVEYIKDRIDFISRYDYNYLFLYLEGRIRTRSFHEFPENLSYSEDEIRDIVAYALSKNIQTIPVVSLFGHAEHFLNFPEFEKYAELQGDAVGRFNSFKHVFCPSNPETLAFLEKYVTEVSALFPCEYFHAGFDEAWDIGYCEQCKRRLKEEGQNGIFSAHLNFAHRIISGKLTKTMMIWDDLYDIYPEALETTPRDIILCSWHYEPIVERPFGHIGGPRSDHFALYDKLGFRYVFAPATHSMRNIMTFTNYAASKNAFGAFLTDWCDSHCSTLTPSIAYAGMLWSRKFSEATTETAIIQTTPFRKKEEITLAELFFTSNFFAPPTNPKAYLRDCLNQGEFERKLIVEAALSVFAKYAACGNETVEKMLILLEAESIYFELRKIIPMLYALRQRFNVLPELEGIRKRISAINAKSKAIQEKERPGKANPRKNYDALEKMGDELMIQKTSAILRVRYPHCTTPLKFFVRYENSASWHRIDADFFGDDKMHGEILIDYPFDMSGKPETVRIDDIGKHVGGSIMYLEVETADSLYVPLGIANIEGHVCRPEALLKDGRDTALFGDGEQQASRKFNMPETVNILSSVELILKRQ